MRALEESVRAQFDAGGATRGDVDATRYYRLEAESLAAGEP